MHVLVTGGGGFVLSNLVKELLQSNPTATVGVIDLLPLDNLLSEFFEPVRDRLTYIQGDARDRDVLTRACSPTEVTHIVDGATVTQTSDHVRFIDVNVMATRVLLEFARAATALERYLYISSIAVYGEPAADAPSGPQNEAGPVDLRDLYAVGKFAAEEMCRLYSEMFGVDTRVARISRVFGPMERNTGSRTRMSVPYHIMRAVSNRRAVRVEADVFHGWGSDFISARDTVSGLAAILKEPQLGHRVYNVAAGAFTDAETLIASFARCAGGLEVEVVATPKEADIPADAIPLRSHGVNGAYSANRLMADVSWRPHEIDHGVAEYVDWVLVHAEARCPPPSHAPSLGLMSHL